MIELTDLCAWGDRFKPNKYYYKEVFFLRGKPENTFIFHAVKFRRVALSKHIKPLYEKPHRHLPNTHHWVDIIMGQRPIVFPRKSSDTRN